MSRAKLGEKGSMSIETLYAYCSGTEEGGSSGVLKSVLDPMYPFFVFPEKKDEFVKKIKILINMYMLEQKQGVYTSKKCVWRAVGIEELKKYLENPNGCIIYGPNSFSRSPSAVRNYIKNPEYSTGENKAINLYRRGIITKDVFQNPELQKWLDSMRKFLDLMYMKAHSRVKDSEIRGKPIRELNTDERY